MTCLMRLNGEKMLKSACLAACVLAVPAIAPAQEPTVRDAPRSFEVFSRAPGYETSPPDQFGTPAEPFPNELGFWLVVQMMRSVCLGIEEGAAAEAVLPDQFAAYSFAPYFFGPDAPPRGDKVVLSSTGDIELDEAGARPAIWLEPAPGGMTCKIEWRVGEALSPESQMAIANLITKWMPWALAFVPASRPITTDNPATSDGIEWDRPCQDRWCPATAFYNLPSGDITLQMTLNITGIGAGPP